MMVNLMRTNQRWMMIIISTLVIISFIWFYSNQSHFDRMSSDQLGTVYGRPLTNSDFERISRQVITAHDLGLTNLSLPEVTNPRNPGLSATNLLVLQHEASALGIEPAQSEVEEAQKNLPAFQAPGGGFDPARYADFVDKRLGPRGFSDKQIEDLVRTDLQVGKLRQVLDSTVHVTPIEVRTAYDQVFSKTEASVVRLKTADFAAATEPTPDEIKKYYDEQKDHFQHPEKRKVQYVTFGLNDEQKKLTGKERIDAMQPHRQETEQLLEKIYDAKGKADFAALAAEAKTTLKETPEFEQQQIVGLPEASIPRFAETAFRLTNEDPFSEAIDTPTAYYILRLSGITPARPMTLEESTPKIVTAIKEERARAALTAKAEEIRTKLAEALKAGRSLADAAKEAGKTVEDVPGFSVAEPPPTIPDAGLIAETALELNKGELSKLVTSPDGGLFVYVRDRLPIDEKKFEQQREMIVRSLQMRKSRFAFLEWLRASREAAEVKLNINGPAMDDQG